MLPPPPPTILQPKAANINDLLYFQPAAGNKESKPLNATAI
jgi:hypothetical protein